MKSIPADVPSRRWMDRRIAFFGKHYSFHADRLVDNLGRGPARAIAELIYHYLTAPQPMSVASDDAWYSFRELRGAGPLTVNFANNTHKTITATFGGDLSALDLSAAKLTGLLESGQGFDRRYRFHAFPEVPLILNYNAADDLFPAQAGLLFHRSTQNLFDIRELFTLGTYLTGRLISSAGHS
ncbi:DUF3786 domain-containing protein [Desulfosarcina variabilis]|uniref:DUF3786 domain-containing protein n=1 Tax=Desulfosarcina variabilis TaxID=2300 RepID=UPI003AFB16E4